MKALSYLNKYLWKYKYRLLLGIIFIFISNIFAIYPAQIIRNSFDVVKQQLSPEDTDLETPDNWLANFTTGMDLTTILIYYAVLVIAMALLRGLFTFFTRQTIIIVSRLIEYDLKNEIYAHYQRLSPGFYRTNNTGDIMNRISEDVSRVRMYLGPGIMYSINMVVLFVLVITTMLNTSVKLTLFSLLPLPFLSAIIYYVSNIINKKSELVQGQQSELSTAAQETFSGIRVLKSYVREAHAISQYDIKSTKYKELALSLIRVEAIFMPVMMVLIGLSTILTVYIGGQEVIANRLSIGNIAEFVIYVNMLTWPVTAIGWVTSLTQRAAASQKRINEFLQTNPEFSFGNSKESIKGKVQFEHVAFTYADSGIKALQDISFEVRPGGSIGIIGRTGSGKSTMIDLLAGNLIPTKGEIKIDDEPMIKLDITELRKNMGIVPQEGFLFSDTIHENIGFGSAHPNPSKEEITDAAERADILDNILKFPKQFDTLVGERGITLSGGQKQRISIARALIRQPRILLLDDCLSAVDTITERKILNNLQEMMKGRTTIIVSHRVSTVENSDEIIVLNQGAIAERGTHDQLMSHKGIYHDMFMQQKLEEENAVEL